MTRLNLATPDLLRKEQGTFDFFGLSEENVEELVNLPHDPETIAGLTKFFDMYNLWDAVEGIVFCLVPFSEIKRVILKGGVLIDDEELDVIGGSVHILLDGRPIMFLQKETFSLSVFRHEMVHVKQVREGLDTRIGLKRHWMGEPKPDYLTYGRDLESQYKLPWELEAYATMYTDEDLKREHDRILDLIERDVEPEQVALMRMFYRMIIIPYGRQLPFEVKILEDELVTS